MAEDVEIDADEGAVEEADEAGEKKSFFKSKLFMILLGTIILFGLVSGGYFFFLSEEEEIETDTIEESEESIDPMAEQMGFEEPMSEMAETVVDANNEDTTATKTEQASSTGITEIQQENSRMKEHVSALEAKLEQMEKAMQNQSSVQNNGSVLSSTNSNVIDYYQQDLTDYSSMRQPNLTPPPKPSWGEFDRINKK